MPPWGGDMVNSAHLRDVRFNELEFRRPPVLSPEGEGFVLRLTEPLRLSVLGEGPHFLQIGLHAEGASPPRFGFALYDDSYRLVERVYLDFPVMLIARNTGSCGVVEALERAVGHWFRDSCPEFMNVLGAAFLRILPPPKEKTAEADAGTGAPVPRPGELGASLDRIRRMRRMREVERAVFGQSQAEPEGHCA